MRKFYAAMLALIMLFTSAFVGAPISAADTDRADVSFNNAKACETVKVSNTVRALIRGDINLDGKVNGTDTNYMKRFLGGNLNTNMFPDIYITGDVSVDGRINGTDVNILKRIIIGKTEIETYYEYGYSAAPYDRTMDAALLTSDRTETNIRALIDFSSYDVSAYSYAVITYLTPYGADGNSSRAVSMALGEGESGKTASLICDGRFHSAVIELSASTLSAETVFDFFTSAEVGDRMFLDSVILCTDAEDASAAAAERESENAGYSFIDGVAVGDAPLAEQDKYGSTVIRFDSVEKVEKYVSLYNGTEFSYDESENALKLSAAGSRVVTDPGVFIDLSKEGLVSEDYDTITLVYKLPTNIKRRTAVCGFYYACGDNYSIVSGCNTSTVELKKENDYNFCTYSVSALKTWSGSLNLLRLDYMETASEGDTCYIDSIILSKNGTGEFSKDSAVHRRRGEGSLHVSRTWIEYWTYHSNENDYEYVTGADEDIQLSFRYASKNALSAESLGARLERAINRATGYGVECSVYRGVSALKEVWSDAVPSAYIFYQLTFEDSTYIVYIKTNIIKDASFTDPLDGDGSETEPSYDVSSSWSASGVSVSDSSALPVSHSSMAAHSNHEVRLVETPYGTFAVIPMEDNGASWGSIKVDFTIYKIEDNGSYKAIGTYQCANHSSKPNIFYAADGLVYVIVGDAQGSYLSAFVAYFDPSSPNADGSYNITAERTDLSYPGGDAPGGYGYTQPILDDTNGLFTIFCCGGSNEGYFSWFVYDCATHKWNTSGMTVKLSTYRHCYLYGFSDGASGVYIVAGRDVLLSTLGIADRVYGANYAWDEVNLFHFPNLFSTYYTMTTVSFADYTQMYANIYPTTSNNARGDAYLSKDGYLHVLSSTRMHRSFHHDTVYWEYWYTVYDVREPGAEPVLVYHEPISFAGDEAEYTARLFEKDGELYMLAMPAGGHRCEVWKQNTEGYGFELTANRVFTDTAGVTTALIVANGRGGSVNDNSISVIYPTDSDGGAKYRFFTVTLGE